MPPFIREQLLQSGRESDFQQFVAEIPLQARNVPIELDSGSVVSPINQHLLLRFSNLLQTDLSQPQEQGGEHWHIASVQDPEGDSVNIAFSYSEEGEPWLTASVDLEMGEGQNTLQGLNVNLAETTILQLYDDQGVMQGSGATMFQGGVDRFLSFLSANMQYAIESSSRKSIMPVLPDIGGRELALPQQEIIQDMIALCGSPERAMVLMGRIFFDGPDDEQWLDYMTRTCGADLTVDRKSEARATISGNPIGKLMLGMINLGIGAMGPLEDIFKFDIGIEPIATTGHELQYRVTFGDGEDHLMTGKELIKFAKTEVLRAFIERMKGN
jgi:hypothetical protein